MRDREFTNRAPNDVIDEALTRTKKDGTDCWGAASILYARRSTVRDAIRKFYYEDIASERGVVVLARCV